MVAEIKGSNERPEIQGQFNIIITCNSRLSVRLEGDADAWRRRLVIVGYRKPKAVKPIADLDGADSHHGGFWRVELGAGGSR